MSAAFNIRPPVLFEAIAEKSTCDANGQWHRNVCRVWKDALGWHDEVILSSDMIMPTAAEIRSQEQPHE